MPSNGSIGGHWPLLPWREWEATAATLHMWTQIVGKTRLVLSPLQAHWWNVPLYVMARGLSTAAMPVPDGVLEIEVSPVHFFWGSFDLAVTRFSGRRAPERPSADVITSEAYSHEVISAGFWPGNGGFGEAAFYCYGAPAPEGLAEKKVRPNAAYWDTGLGEFILKYEDLRRESSPDEALMAFLESTYDATADAAKWDRAAPER